MRKLFSILLIITVFTVTTGGLAQDALELLVPCGELSQDDCDMLVESNRIMAMLTSGSFDMDMAMGVSGLEDSPELSFDMNIAGSYEGDWSQFIATLSPEKVAVIASDPATYAEFIKEMMTSFSLDITMSMSPSEALLEVDDLLDTFTFSMMMVDGVIYFNFDEIKSQLPPEETEDLPDGWVGFDFARWMGLFSRVGMTLSDQQYILNQIENVVISNQFADVTRLDDEQASDGATLAVFQTDYNMSAMMRSPEYQAYLLDSMRLPERMDNDESSGKGFNAMIEMMATLMDGLSITETSKINTENLYLYEATFDFTWDSSPIMTNVVADVRGVVAGIFGDFADPSPIISGPAMFMRGTVLMSDFNDAEPITPPEGATVLRLETLIEMFFDAIRENR